MAYAELHCHSYFSLLDGASSPEALAARAQALGLTALALTDHDSLAGIVRFGSAMRSAGLKAIVGAEVSLADGHHLTLLAETQEGYGNLCRLISAARLEQLPKAEAPSSLPAASLIWPGKVEPRLTWERLAESSAGLIALTGCRQGPLAAALLREEEETAVAAAGRLLDLFGPQRVFVELQHHDLPDDDRLVRRLAALARRLALSLVAAHNVHYAEREESRLRDALIAVRHNESLEAARRAGHLPLNSSYALASPASMARRFRERPDALANILLLAERCQVSLDFSAQRLPFFAPAGCELGIARPGSPFSLLYQLCHAQLARCYPQLTPPVLKQLAHELEIIERLDLAGYFLIVWDIVRFAREAGIRCQGRGSAANSIVAYLLGITAVDPLRYDLLFERFLSSDKFTMPDIDIDFAADRREEVIQYVYRTYGAAHTAMVCNVVTYRARSALRDLGKVLDVPLPVIEALIHSLDTDSPGAAAEELEGRFSASQPPSPVHRLLFDLLRRIDGCPRHLSIHTGGMLITAAPLDAIVPLEPAAMPGRIVCQWDKESVEDAGLIKIDLLGLRTLGLIDEALRHIAAAGGSVPDLEEIPLDDPALYAMLAQGDTIGVFQVESRAQQQMLPRLRPARFEDIIVEIAIVRPGPIQGGAVHPYLRRRAGEEAVTYLHPRLEPVLGETLGVLLFQEQAIRVAVTAAGFAPGEADLLRRALSRTHAQAAMAALRERFVQGAGAQGIDPAAAEAIFAQLAGFAGYGFCKSHAASFARIAYQTLYLKRYHPAAFYCALLNQQPMGFYPPEVIAGDARRHGVELLPPDVQRSGWLYRLEREPPALRSGLCTVAGLGEEGGKQILAARPFADLADFCWRTRLDRDAVANLIRAGALAAFGERRRLLWQLGNLPPVEERALSLPNFVLPEIEATLPPLDALEQTAWEYELLGLSPAGQIMAHYRRALRRAGVLACWEVKEMEPGRRVRVAGLAVVRQRPSTAKGILFLSLEDESGLLDLVVKPAVDARLRDVLRGHPLICVAGIVQRAGAATSVLVDDAVKIR